jgi:regulator of protease activity HflC (stomatin/prohibitin superfamily)
MGNDFRNLATSASASAGIASDRIRTYVTSPLDSLPTSRTILKPNSSSLSGEIVKATTAKFNAEELITEREIVKEQIDAALKDRLATRNLVVETTSITNFAFPDAFNQAITAKQTAVQRAPEAQNKLEQVKFEAQQAVSKAEGDAKAMDIINQQLMKSPQYINYLAVQKWSRTLPLATGGAIPFIQLPTTT